MIFTTLLTLDYCLGLIHRYGLDIGLLMPRRLELSVTYLNFATCMNMTAVDQNIT